MSWKEKKKLSKMFSLKQNHYFLTFYLTFKLILSSF